MSGDDGARLNNLISAPKKSENFKKDNDKVLENMAKKGQIKLVMLKKTQ